MKNKVVCLFDRVHQKFRSTQPVNTAVIQHFYSFEKEDGTKDSTIEGLLSSIERKAAQAIESLSSTGKISDSQRIELAHFVGFMVFRTPRMDAELKAVYGKIVNQQLRMMFNTLEKAQQAIFEDEEDTGEKSNADPQQIVDHIKNGKIAVGVTRNMTLSTMIDLSGQTAKVLSRMNWMLISAPDRSSFVTSDNPFTLLPPSNLEPDSFGGIGICSPGAIKWMPLTQKFGILFGDNGGCFRSREGTQAEIRWLNLMVTEWSYRFVIARDETLIKSLVKETQIDERPPNDFFSIS